MAATVCARPTSDHRVDGYRLYRHDRPADSGLPKGYGGVAVLARDTFDVTVLGTPHTAAGSSNLEIVWTIIRPARGKQIVFGSLYRHPTHTARQVSDDLDDLEGQLQCIMSTHDCPIVIAGDLNINLMGSSTGAGYPKLMQLLETYNLHICNNTRPTYRPTGSLLDVTITNRKDLVQRCGVTVCHYSPHDFTRTLLKVSKKKQQTTIITSRCLKRVDFDYLNEVLANADWSSVY